MSAVYVKVDLISRNHGGVVGSAMLIKNERSFYLAAEDYTLSGMNIPAEALATGSHDMQQQQLTFTIGGGRVKVAYLDTMRMASFTTMATKVNAQLIPWLANHTMIITSGAPVEMQTVFTYDLDDVFAHERQISASIDGIDIKRGYTTTTMYSGFSSYHNNQRTNVFNTPLQADKPWRIGVELELYAKTQSDYNAITRMRTNWFQCESDGSLTERSYPIEMKTIPLKACDAKSVDFWSRPMDALKVRAVSKGCHTTGLHVHIGKEIFGMGDELQLNCRKLAYFYYCLIENDADAAAKNATVCGRTTGYGVPAGGAVNFLCENVKFAKRVKIFDRIAKEVDAAKEMMEQQYVFCAHQRWDINFGNINGYGTIEFRKGDGRISKVRLAALCSWWETMCLYVKETPVQDLSFDDFFARACREYPSIASYFNVDVEG